MKVIDALQKTIIVNKILTELNKLDIGAGEKVTIEFDTKRNGELKTFKITKGE